MMVLNSGTLIEANSSQKQRIVLISLCLLFVTLVVSIILLASVPPVSRDALTHHLFVPKLYIEHGGIYEIESIPFSYYPMNLDLLYMIPLYFGDDIIPKYIHFIFALLTALLIYNYLKNRISEFYGLLGALFFLSIPIIVKLSITVYVDLGLMFFTTSSLLLLFRWLNSGHRIRYLILAGVCCGLAAGTKYNGMVSLFLLSLFTPVLYMRTGEKLPGSSLKAIGFALIFVLASLAAYSPWLIRNYAWTGNPIYPLYNSLFQHSGKHQSTQSLSPQALQTSIAEKLTKMTNRGSSVFANRKILYHETWWQALLLPIRFFFEGKDDDPRYFDGKLNPFLFFLPFFAFLRPPGNVPAPTGSSKNLQMEVCCENNSAGSRIRLEKYALLSFTILFFLFTFFQEALRIRYIVTIVPSLVLLSTYGLHNIGRAFLKKRFSRGLIAILTASLLIYNGQYLIQQLQIIQPLAYLNKSINRDQYITRFRPEYPAIQYANQHLTTNTKILCLFLGKRGYYMHFQPVFLHPGPNGLFKNRLSKAQRQISIKDEMTRRGVTHILLRNDLTDAWYQNLSRKARDAITFFFQYHTKQMYSSGGYTLYAIQ